MVVLFAFLFLLPFGAGTAWADDIYQVQVNQNVRIDVQITDADGRAVAPGKEIDSIRYVVKSKPENAKVSVYTLHDAELKDTGKFSIAFTCNTAGTVELESFVITKEATNFYTGNHTITVLEQNTQLEKIVILSIGSCQMIVNNDVVQADAAPVVQNGRTYVPLRALSDIFDAECHYDAATQQITIQNDSRTIELVIGEEQFSLNGESYPMDAPAFLTEQGRTMVPIRFLANAFGAVIKPTYRENGTVADIMLQL